jgi:hypothetical protein
MAHNWQLGKGSFTLGDYRFSIDPISSPEDEQKIELPQAYERGLGNSGEMQTWAVAYSDLEQVFQWDTMPSEMYDEIHYYKEQAISDRDITFNFIYHNKTPEQTWSCSLIDFTGTKRNNVWYGVKLSIRLIENISV